MPDSYAPPRIVVTGIGVISAGGHDTDTFFSSLLEGKSGIDHISCFDVSDIPSKIGAEIKGFDPSAFMDAKEARRNDRYTQMAVGAGLQAVSDAGLKMESVDPERCGVLVGSGIGGMQTIETQSRTLFEKGPRRVSPFMIPSLIANIASGRLAIELGARGPNFAVVSACATSTHALGESFRIMRTGDADVMIAGGSEAAITRLGYAGFCSMKAMSTRNDDPQAASRPFEKSRDGFVMGEGAGVFVMETLEHARARGARIYCELVGYAATCDAFHITQPDTDGTALTECILRALKSAGMPGEEIDYINAHGTSTYFNDKCETMAVKKAFGDHAYKLMMGSTKSMTGHLLGAAGSVEAAVCAKVIETGEVPPTINYDEPDPELDLDYVPNKKRSARVKVAMTNNSGFGGHNASLIFKAYED